MITVRLRNYGNDVIDHKIKWLLPTNLDDPLVQNGLQPHANYTIQDVQQHDIPRYTRLRNFLTHATCPSYEESNSQPRSTKPCCLQQYSNAWAVPFIP